MSKVASELLQNSRGKTRLPQNLLNFRLSVFEFCFSRHTSNSAYGRESASNPNKSLGQLTEKQDQLVILQGQMVQWCISFNSWYFMVLHGTF